MSRTVVDRRKFNHGGKSYETVVVADRSGFHVRVLHNNKPANGYEYSVTFEVNEEYEWDRGTTAFGHLMDVAEADLKSGMWDKLMEARERK
jgi:hypothetical protein